MDKRRATRVEFETSAVVNYRDRTITGTIENLSLKGLFLKTREIIPEGETAEVAIRLSGSTSELVIKVMAEVTRTDDTGIGLKFIEMELDSYVHLKNVIFYADNELHDFNEFL